MVVANVKTVQVGSRINIQPLRDWQKMTQKTTSDLWWQVQDLRVQVRALERRSQAQALAGDRGMTAAYGPPVFLIVLIVVLLIALREDGDL